MKPITILTLAILFPFAFSAFGQSLIIPKGVNLPKDSVVKNELIASLNGLLAQKEKPNNQNTFVLKEDLLATSALLDEMKGMEKSRVLKEDNFYKGYLTNVVDLGDDNFLVQFSYIGTAENAPVLRASFRILAKWQDGHFYFSSPLKQNTASWKTKKLSYINFHFKDDSLLAEAKIYLKTVNFYDGKLKAPSRFIEFYFCNDFPDVLQTLGVDYKLDYNGIKFNDLTSHENDENLQVNGGYYGHQRFDRHDLWHARLRTVLSVEVTNRPVDEGCAYLYGGSWGISWVEILAMFKKYAADNPNADWLKLYTETTGFSDGEKPLKIAYAINALIVQKVEREKGFAPVLELLSCGRRQTGDDNYFKALEKVSGITKADFNTTVWKLIKAEN